MALISISLYASILALEIVSHFQDPATSKAVAMAHEIGANDSPPKSSAPAKSIKSKHTSLSIFPAPCQFLPITVVTSEAAYNYFGSLTADQIIEEAD